MKKTIKKHTNKNHYLLTKNGFWVRDFTRHAYPVDINNITAKTEYRQLAHNEATIRAMNLASIDVEHVRATDIVIVSDGYKFEEKKHLLKTLPRKVMILGTNRTLAKWSPDLRMDYFIANNPYQECMACLPPASYVPKCIVSARTFPEFVWRYRQRRGTLYRYTPVRESKFSGLMDAVYYIDDYRNPICAAIGLAHRFGVRRLMLFCCDDAFEGERPAAEKLPNGLYQYPQHDISHSLIEGNLFWLQNQKYTPTQVVNHSSGPEYEHVVYIKDKDIGDFFQ
jgi:hypothetical protein